MKFAARWDSRPSSAVANNYTLFADNGSRSIANRFIMQGLTLGGGNNLRITGTVDFLGSPTLQVDRPVELELAGSIGELVSAAALTKAGSGFLTISAPAYYSGATTINAVGGEIRLTG